MRLRSSIAVALVGAAQKSKKRKKKKKKKFYNWSFEVWGENSLCERNLIEFFVFVLNFL